MDVGRIAEIVLPLAVSIFGSTGLWAWLQAKNIKHDAAADLLIGVARSQIIALGRFYIERGYILIDEYDDLYNYLYKPYTNAGGNGLAKKVFEEVEDLPMLPKGSDRRKV